MIEMKQPPVLVHTNASEQQFRLFYTVLRCMWSCWGPLRDAFNAMLTCCLPHCSTATPHQGTGLGRWRTQQASRQQGPRRGSQQLQMTR